MKLLALVLIFALVTPSFASAAAMQRKKPAVVKRGDQVSEILKRAQRKVIRLERSECGA